MSFLKLENDQSNLPKKFSELQIFNREQDDETHNISSLVDTEGPFHNYKKFIDNNEKSDEDENYLEDLLKNIMSPNGQNSYNALGSPAYFSGSSSNASNNTDTQVVQVNEDDIIDLTSEIKQLFQQEFIEKHQCRCDVNSSQFVPKFVKFSKALQRKLINFNQLLDTYETNLTSLQKIDGYDFTFDKKKLTYDNLNKLLAASNASIESSDSSEILRSKEIINFILHLSITNQEFKKKLFRSLRSLVECVLIDSLAICDHFHMFTQQQEQNYLNSANFNTQSTVNSSNPTSKLWLEIRKSGCQFLGPQMQDDVLRLILHCLNVVGTISRKNLVLYVVSFLKKQYPKASKTSVGHVVQLLYKAGCFIVHKREGNASLMELKKEFTKYKDMRRLHDTQIIHIALTAGIRMSPEQWSQKLFGDSSHKSQMQSIIDKLQSQQTLENLINDFYNKALHKISTDYNSFQDKNENNFPFGADGSTSLAIKSNKQTIAENLTSIFLEVKEDFEFFSAIIFEKKSPPQPPSVNPIGYSSHSSTSTPPHAITKDGEHLQASSNVSEIDDDEPNFNDIFEDDDNFDDMSNSVELRVKSKIPEQEQTKIVWSLLIECMTKTIEILEAHMNFSLEMTRLMDSSNGSVGFNQINSINNGSNLISKTFLKDYGYQRNNGFLNKNTDLMIQRKGTDKPKQIMANKDFAFNLATNGNRNLNNRMKNQLNYDYQQYMENNVQQYIPNSASQAFGMPNNMLYNGFSSSAQFFNPSINQQAHTVNQFHNDFNSLFYDQNNNTNNSSIQFSGTLNSSFQPERSLQYNQNSMKTTSENKPQLSYYSYLQTTGNKPKFSVGNLNYGQAPTKK